MSAHHEWSPLALSGWLLADLALLLVIIVMGSQSPTEIVAQPSPSVSPHPSYTHTAAPAPSSPTPRPSAAPTHQKGLDPHSTTFSLLARSTSQAELDRVSTEVTTQVRSKAHGRPVGLIFVFGTALRGQSPNSGQSTLARPIAQRVADRLHLDTRLVRPYLTVSGGSSPYGDVTVEVFFVS